MKKHSLKALCAFLSISSLFLSSCAESGSKQKSIALFVPGIIADSPTYAKLVKGTESAVEEFNGRIENVGKKTKLTVMEAGTNQAEWATKLTALVASGKYDLIVSSNPSLPELAAPLTEKFPNQKFILLDGALEGNPNIACISYNQKEQTYLAGYISSLMSKNHKTGLIAGQEYPVMNKILYPYFERGAKDAVKGTTCEFRVVGNWYDASKGAELTDALCAIGVDVILPICGGASSGVISSAKENKIKLAYIDENSFARAPGTVICSCSTRQDTAAKEAVLGYLSGNTEWGTTKTLGLQEGYIEYIQDDELYEQAVPEDIRKKMSVLVEDLKSGKVTVPEL